MVSGSLSLPSSGCFSPFPHGTGPLSVSREYLALPDGPGRFAQDYSCPALLRIPLGLGALRIRGSHPLWPNFPERSARYPMCRVVVLLPRKCIATPAVWALPRSLATTGGITFCFLFLEVLRCFSSLRSPHYNCVMMTVLQTDGLSHSEIRGSKDICSYPRLIAAYHVLHRLHEPRHPPCALIHFLGSGHQHGRSYFQLYPDKQKMSGKLLC